MKTITKATFRVLGFEIAGIEVEQNSAFAKAIGKERVRQSDVRMPVNPEVLKPIARAAVAFLEPHSKATVQSDPSFDESMASEFDVDMACEEIAKDGVTKKGAGDLTYAFLLLGPLSEQPELARIFKGAISIVIEDHWPSDVRVRA